MTNSDMSGQSPMPFSEQADGLLPAFTARQYSHLPTPQSPGNLGRYLNERPSPESPVPQRQDSFYSTLGLPNCNTFSQFSLSSSSVSYDSRNGTRRAAFDDNAMGTQSKSKQCATPESSPQFSLNSPLSINNSATPRHLFTSLTDFTTPKQGSSIKLESPTPLSASTMISSRTPPPPSPPSAHSLHSSALSSPFMGGLSLEEHRKDTSRRVIQPTQVDDVFSSQPRVPVRQQAAVISTPPVSPPQDPAAVPPAGGEMERIRQALLDDRISQIQEAEKRRPEYLKRTKRTLSEADPNYLEDEETDRDRTLPVGIMESPHKGRRLKLFQETSDESFEESLMAGGYGRYRTADWVRQPQPISLPPSAVAGSSTVISLLEEAEDKPPTEKELKKRKRLAAFRSAPSSANTRLCAVELEGKGRVLVDVPTPDQPTPGSPEPTPSKRKAANRRKKKAGEGSMDKKSGSLLGGTDDHSDKLNWPDAEFPWRLRTEERIEEAKAEEDERLRWIERFLDRDSDDEEDVEPLARVEQSSFYDYRSETTPTVTMGRGKMVPLRVASDDSHYPMPRRSFHTDPADALAALLSKKRVRTLSYRQQKRQRGAEDDEDDDDIVCICHGRDDGRELVQCDACQTWYHLDCIGIKDIAELGREEDPWFCRRCVAHSRSPSAEPEEVGEPTFVPTDNEPSGRRSSDTPFFPSVPESPGWASTKVAPRTPTRGNAYSISDATHSWTSWPDPSRHAPSTPHQYYSGPVRIYNASTPGAYDGHNNPSYYDESPFDPTSTPSRGIKFTGPFATPKNSTWPQRPNALFNTPSKPTGRGGSNRASFGQLPSHSAVLDDTGSSATDHFGRLAGYDESPIRRNTSREGPTNRRKLHPVPASSMLQESPVMRSIDTPIQRVSDHRVIARDIEKS